ncbi:MAG: lipoprotein [Pseudomonadota bacterium]
MDKRRRTTLALLLMAVGGSLAGCGQKGPLFLPEEKLEDLKKKRKVSMVGKRSGDRLV